MRRITLMVTLVVAGELVFGLAFNVPRFFRPTMLEVFGITVTQLGDRQFLYGIAALLAYFPGGALADHFNARALMAGSLFATALGGVYLWTLPGAIGLAALYFFWGVTTIFLFWGAMIRATRDWGGDSQQGVAFGILDGGRGLVAASVAFIGVNLLAFYLPDDARLATSEAREAGFQAVVLFYTLLTFLTAALVWFVIPATDKSGRKKFNPFAGMGQVLRRPVLWAQASIIVCAYCGYKGLDNYSLYAEQILGMDEVDAALLSTYGAWTRPVAAVMAGLIADRFDATRAIGVTFVLLAVFFGLWSMLPPSGFSMALIYVNFFATYALVFALRGIYFALLEEIRTPRHLTGAAVGMISMVGFTPDFFFPPITGRILDANPGLVGFQNYFVFLATISALGVVAVLCLIWLRRRGGGELWSLASGEAK